MEIDVIDKEKFYSKNSKIIKFDYKLLDIFILF